MATQAVASSMFSVMHHRGGTWMFPRCIDFDSREKAEAVAAQDRARGIDACVYEWPPSPAGPAPEAIVNTPETRPEVSMKEGTTRSSS